MEKFEIGEAVALKSTLRRTPALTVIDSHDDSALCGWFNTRDDYKEEYFPNEALIPLTGYDFSQPDQPQS